MAHVNSYHVPGPDRQISAALAEVASQFGIRMLKQKADLKSLGEAALDDPGIK